MIVIEEEGYSVILTGVTQMEVDDFFKYLKNKTPYYGVVGRSKFKVPKNEKKVDVFVIDCLNSRGGRQEILDYWIKKGQKYNTDNISLLNTLKNSYKILEDRWDRNGTMLLDI